MENDALGGHLLDAPLNMALLELEVGNAVTEQASSLRVFLVDVDLVAGPRKLLRASQARWARTDNGDLLAGFVGGGLRLNPSFGEGAIDNRAFDRLDGHRRVLNVERARRFARRGANSAGHFREIVGGEQVARGFLPLAAIGEVVPIRDLIVDRAARVTIGDAAIHAPRRLVPVASSLSGRTNSR